MPRVRLELDQPTFDALVEAAVRERRPIPWHAEIILRRALGTRSGNPTPTRPIDVHETGDAPRGGSCSSERDADATEAELR